MKLKAKDDKVIVHGNELCALDELFRRHVVRVEDGRHFRRRAEGREIVNRVEQVSPATEPRQRHVSRELDSLDFEVGLRRVPLHEERIELLTHPPTGLTGDPFVLPDEL